MSYLALVGVAVVLAGVPFAVAARRWARRGTLAPMLTALAVALVVLCALTVVFDSLMIGAALFRYGAGTLTGVLLWRAPVEDLGYPLVAVLLLPAVWELLGPRTQEVRR
jgi:lycopene cyclase domain-containing protein